MKLGVELGAVEDAERDDVEPEEERDAGAERAVDLGIVGKTGDIPAEGDCSDEPHDCGENSAGQDSLPGLLDRRSQVIDETDDADASGKSDDPAEEKSEDEDRG